MTTKNFYPAKKISTFYPPQRTLMGPGPSDTHPRVLSAMARPTLGHLDPVFTDMMEGPSPAMICLRTGSRT